MTEADPSRDIVCCLTDYKVKEEILRKAQNKIQLEHKGNIIHIYQDLSAITLRHCKDLCPLLEILKNKGIHYWWKFPFGLSATHQGHSALLRVLEELETFCHTLDIALIGPKLVRRLPHLQITQLGTQSETNGSAGYTLPKMPITLSYTIRSSLDVQTPAPESHNSSHASQGMLRPRGVIITQSDKYTMFYSSCFLPYLIDTLVSL